MSTTPAERKSVGVVMPPPDGEDRRPADLLKINVSRRVTNLLIPTPLPRPEPNKKNDLGQQLHQTEMRSGGVIAYRVPLHQKMVVGALSGVIGMSVVFPVDLVKTRLQLLSSGTAVIGGGGGLLGGSGGGGGGNASALASSSSVGISRVCRDVYAHHGIGGFYRGLGATSIMIAPEKAIKLGVNDYLRDVFCDYDRTGETITQQVAAGALTGVVQVVATNPMEVLKIRLQTAEIGGGSPFAVARELGLRGLYNGSAVTLARDVPYNVIFFMTYIRLKRALTSSDGHVARERIFGSGVAAGVVAAWAGTPMDVVKSRIQMRDSPYKSGALDCARRLYGEGGYPIFFRGAVPRMAVQGPLYGISLLFFELQNQYLSSAR